MENVGSTELKNELNSYLKKVKSGAKFLITERGRPIARIVPLTDSDDTSTESIIAELLNKGLLTLSRGLDNEQLLSPKPIIKLSGISASDIIIKDRDK